MLLSDTIVDFHLFYDGAVDIQMWALLTRSQCKVSDTQVTVKACGPLVCPSILLTAIFFMCKFVLLLKLYRKMFLMDPWCIAFSQLIFSLNYMYAMPFLLISMNVFSICNRNYFIL